MRSGESSNADTGHSGATGGHLLPVGNRIAAAPEALEQERAFLLKIGFSKPFMAKIFRRAQENGTTLEDELLADGMVQEEAYYGALARALRLDFTPTIDPRYVDDRIENDVQFQAPKLLRCHEPDRLPHFAVVPSAQVLMHREAKLNWHEGIRSRVVITTRKAVRDAVWKVGAARRVHQAANGLFEAMPDHSARIVVTGVQAWIVASFVYFLVIFLLLSPALTLVAAHCLVTFAFFLSMVLRGLALQSGKLPPEPQLEEAAENLPVYTVLVPLHHEAAMANQLVSNLDRLDWPKSMLDIKFLCEENDVETIAALEAAASGPQYEIVRVPEMAPQTKPKALNYGLAAARGALLVIYDAEDRPDPKQLREAYARFAEGPAELACLQAPLVISNAASSWLSGLFAVEYAGLFRRVLPLLASLHLPMPLGGTSNHFRTDILREVGGWDAHNVTEDADLGLRLHRFGYTTGTISRPTEEDAPTEWDVWIGQRTRWLKGWMQTWLVAMRHPAQLGADLGARGTIAFHLVITGMLISALCHPLIALFAGASVWRFLNLSNVGVLERILFGFDAVNLFGAYLLFGILGWKAMTPGERTAVGLRWFNVPIYWLMISLAAWRAVIDLYRRPHYWKKTPHRPMGPRRVGLSS